VTVRHDDAAGRSPAEAALVARLEALSTEFAAAPDEQVRAATRARLVAMAAVRTPTAGGARRPPARVGPLRRLLTGTPDAPAPRWRTRLTAGLAGAALTVAALAGLLAGAQGARPGDLLYDVKRGGEQTQLVLAGNSRRGPTLLHLASTRLDELGDLVGVQPDADAVVATAPSGGELGLASGPDVDLVLDTLHTMDAQTTAGTSALTTRALQRSDADALHTLTGWAARQRAGLDRLADAVPPGARAALTVSQDLIDRVGARGTGLGQALDCPGGPSTAGTDELGPRPAACPPVPETTATTAAPPSPTAVAPPATGSAPETLPAGTSATGTSAAGAVAPGTTAPAATTAAAPRATVPRATARPPGITVPVPSPPFPLPSLSLPSLPAVPGLPGAPTSSARATSSGAGVSLPPVAPGVSVCLPPLVTVGC
jgi:hypothetical protein